MLYKCLLIEWTLFWMKQTPCGYDTQSYHFILLVWLSTLADKFRNCKEAEHWSLYKFFNLVLQGLTVFGVVALVCLVPPVRFVQVGLGVYFALVVLLFGLVNFIIECGCSHWLVHAVRPCYQVVYYTDYLWTYRSIRRRAWNETLSWDWDFRFGWLFTQIYPWTFWGTRRFLVINWPRRPRSCGETCYRWPVHWIVRQGCRSCLCT